jgi:hypothetical protein
VRRVSIVSALLSTMSCAAPRAPRPAPVSRPAPVRCDEVAFALPPVGHGRAAALVITVNDEVCRREPLVPGLPAPRGRVADWCPTFEAGGNRVEISVIEGACGRARSRAVFACAGPDPVD